jgi:dihydrofolate reductase
VLGGKMAGNKERPMSGKLVLKMRQTIDGFVCTETGDDAFLRPHIDEEALTWETEHLWRAGVHIMGRNLYQIMASYWPTSKELPAAPMNEIPKAVFSKTLKAATWGPASILSGDLAEEISRLKQRSDGDILAHGGASFAQSLARLNLIDEYRLLVHPVALGSGKRCINSPLNLRLTSCHQFSSGVVALIYSRA